VYFETPSFEDVSSEDARLVSGMECWGGCIELQLEKLKRKREETYAVTDTDPFPSTFRSLFDAFLKQLGRGYHIGRRDFILEPQH
jgi:hypothetical protein